MVEALRQLHQRASRPKDLSQVVCSGFGGCWCTTHSSIFYPPAFRQCLSTYSLCSDFSAASNAIHRGSGHDVTIMNLTV